jgi:hypothetical protein
MTDDLVQRLRVGDYYPDGDIGYHEISPGKVDALCEQAADRIEAQAAEIRKWHTVSRAYLDRIETLRAEIERLNKSAECLAESRRLAVKDLAELEEHMRVEIRQWKVDYDCAIMDVEQLREWVTALEVLLDCAVADYCDQNGRPKHDLHWVNQSRAILEQTK